jgi:hypothetical protein
LKQWRLAQLQPGKNFVFYEVDISDRSALEPLFTTQGSEPPFDAVINLAGRASRSFFSAMARTAAILHLSTHFAVESGTLAMLASSLSLRKGMTGCRPTEGRFCGKNAHHCMLLLNISK